MRTAFLIPGVCGDDPDLIDFRDRLSGQLTLNLVELPDAGSPGSVLSSMRATAASAVAQIMARQPDGSIALVGFSFGGSAALEVATQLEAAGRHIAFLGIIDGPFGMDELQGWFELFRRATTAKGAVRSLVEVAASTDITRRLAWASAAPEKIGKQSDPVRRAMLAHLRGKALKGWVPGSCKADGILVRTTVFGTANRDRWTGLCPNLGVIDVPGKHEDLLRGDSLGRVAAIIAEATASVEAVG